MLPEDAAVLLAKVIFVVSAAMVLCMARVKACEINYNPTNTVEIVLEQVK